MPSGFPATPCYHIKMNLYVPKENPLDKKEVLKERGKKARETNVSANIDRSLWAILFPHTPLLLTTKMSNMPFSAQAVRKAIQTARLYR